MTEKEYRKHTDRDLIGRKVRSVMDLSNGYVKVPKGSIFTIGRKYKGFTLTSEKCPCCGMQAKITRVPPSDVEFALT